MKRLFVFLVLLAGCSEYPHTFKDSDKVVISGKFNGVVTNARDRVHKNEYVRVEWVDQRGILQDEWVHYKLLTPVK